MNIFFLIIYVFSIKNLIKGFLMKKKFLKTFIAASNDDADLNLKIISK